MLLLLGALALTSFPIIHAQIEYDSKTNRFRCPLQDSYYCAAESLQGSSIIYCPPDGIAEIRSCNTELARILPVGYEETAVCYESSSNSGDAVCAFNGMGHALSGLKVSIPETVLCDDVTLSVRSSDEDNDYIRDEKQTVGKNEIRSRLGIVARDEQVIRPTSLALGSILHTRLNMDSRDQTLSIPQHLAPPSTSNNVGEGKGISCSNPEARGDTRTRDILMLDIVLVVPTTSVEVSGTQLQPSPWPSTAALTTQFLHATSTLILSEGGSGHSSSVVPTAVATAVLAPSVTGHASASGARNNGGSGGYQKGFTSDVENLHLKTVAITAVFTLTLWTCVLFGCF